MKRILLSLALLTTVAVGAQAQGAGLSQGQAVVQTTANPTQTRKRCANCGITMGNITYPWQHESWCPYYRSSGGSSSSRSSSRSYGTYTAASAASTALGSLLSGLISNGFSRKNEYGRTAKQQSEWEELSKRVEERERQKALGQIMYNQDKQSWNYGDYAISIVDRQACIRNTKTGKWVKAPYDTIVFKRNYPNVPEDGFYVPVLNDYEFTGHGFDEQGRIRFLNSKITGTSPELDGYLLLRLKRPRVHTDKKTGKKDVHWNTFYYDALCRIVDDTLQFVLESENIKRIEYKGNVVYDKDGKVMDKEGLICVLHHGDEEYYEPVGAAPYISGEVIVYVNGKKKADDKKYYTHYVYDKQGNIVAREVDYIETVGGSIYAKYHSGETKWYDYNFKEIQPPFGNWAKKETGSFGKIFLIQKDGVWGVLGQSDKVILPFVYGSKEDVDATLNYLNTISYTLWYKQEAAKYIDKKGEFEKTEHFEARMQDATMQEEYLRERMEGAELRYLKEKTKGGLNLSIGQYDADNECFPINLGIAPWNSFLLPVPIAEAEAFKDAFIGIKTEAEKSAELGIRYDAPSVEAITFTTSDGKTYRYGD